MDSGREWRGGQAQVWYLIQGLKARGHDQVLAAPRESPLASKVRSLGVPVEEMGGRGDLNPWGMLRLRSLMRRQRTQVAHAHAAHAHVPALAAARLAGVPFKVVTRRLDLKVGASPWSRAKYRARGVQYIAISNQVAGSLIEAGVPAERVSIVPSGVPVEAVSRADDPAARSRARAALSVTGDGPVIGLVGAFTAQKGQDTAIEALARMRSPARLVLLGDGPDRPRIEALIRESRLENRVRLAGHRDDVSRLWPAFDLVWAPSRHEGLGTSVLEAMAAGVPVVASRVSAFPEVLEEGQSGCLVSAHDTAAWARVTDALLEDPAECHRLAKAGLSRVQHFTADRMVDGTERVYTALATGLRESQ